MKQKRYGPWLKAFSQLSINISAAWFATPFIGHALSIPNNLLDFFVLTINIVFGIVFLLLGVFFEKRLEK